jgi:NAD(P)-dependent dehydrogenase (short-subunit alcohol dehydrogenase family)
MKKTILITGATDGLGRGLAVELASHGHTVLVHGRSPERTAEVVGQLGGRGRPYVADLASLAEVRRFADEVSAQEPRLDVLINNAATASRERELSADGHEMSFAVNYLSHFLLTLRLVPLLERSSPARIINVSSVGQVPISFDDVMLEHKYSGVRAYSQSKLAQIMFTFDLAEKLPAGVTVNAIHPATLMDTKMVRAAFGKALTTVQEGVNATLRLVTDPALEGVSGRYYDKTTEARASAQAYDVAARATLWQLSDRMANSG